VSVLLISLPLRACVCSEKESSGGESEDEAKDQLALAELTQQHVVASERYKSELCARIQMHCKKARSSIVKIRVNAWSKCCQAHITATSCASQQQQQQQQHQQQVAEDIT
jgi:hypothetical protein